MLIGKDEFVLDLACQSPQLTPLEEVRDFYSREGTKIKELLPLPVADVVKVAFSELTIVEEVGEGGYSTVFSVLVRGRKAAFKQFKRNKKWDNEYQSLKISDSSSSAIWASSVKLGKKMYARSRIQGTKSAETAKWTTECTAR